MKYFAIIFAIACTGHLVAGGNPEQPLGFVSTASGGWITPLGLKTPISAQAGDFLFSGDTLSGPPGSITFYLCTQKGDGYKVALSQPFRLSGDIPSQQRSHVDTCLMPEAERWPNVAVIPDLLTQLGSRDGMKQRIEALPEEAKAPLEALSQGGLSDPRLQLAFGVLLQKSGLFLDAAWQYWDLSQKWPGQPRLCKLVFDLLQTPANPREIVHPESSPNNAQSPRGKTFALVVGISKYEQNSIPDLQFAANDAKEFAEYLRTRRGAADEVYELTDAQATSGAIRQTFNKLYAKAGPRDSVVLLVAAHGDMDPGRDIPIVITHRADPQDTTMNSFPMSELQQWLLGKKTPFGNAKVYLDVCHAGRFAQFTPGAGKNYFFLLATRAVPNALAYESAMLKTCPLCQGDDSRREGHGAFTYFLLRGLNTQEAKDPGSQFITNDALAEYVSDNVSRITNNKQRPTDLSGSKGDPHAADLNLPGLNPFDTPEVAKLNISGGRNSTRRVRHEKESKPPLVTPPSYPTDLAQSIEVENRGEDVLLKYLKGDEIALGEGDFLACRDSFHQLLAREPGSPYLSAREAFCAGRAEVFRVPGSKRGTAGQTAQDLLEKAIRLDPGAAYPYNALGILWLERSQYDLARAAFEDAIHWAPLWAYPRHNLALTMVQSGDYEAAVATYKEAMALAPQFFYLPYSLGLVYERMNQLEEAETSYRQAASLAPQRPEPYTGMGAVRVLRGEWKQAETDFRRALEQPNPLPVAAQAARHNLAMVLASHSGGDEAVRLWNQNAGYLPSELSLAQYFEATARKLRWRDAAANSMAVDHYRTALVLSGGELHMRMLLVEVLQQSGRVHEAIIEDQTAVAGEPHNAAPLEKLGDLLLMDNRRAEACKAYQQAVAADSQSPASKHLLQKQRTCAGASR